MKNAGFVAIILVLIFSGGCKPSRNKSMTGIQNLESKLYSPSATTFNKEDANRLLSLYDNFIKEFPKDTLVPVYLFKAANLEMNGMNANGAIARFDELIRNYPSDPKAPASMFFKGYIYENNLKDLEKAKEAYLLFIETYPSHELVKDAKMSIKNLGKTPEQMIKEFEMMQKQDSIRKADSLADLAKGKKKQKRKGSN